MSLSSTQVYPASAVDQLLEDMMGVVAEAMAEVKSASEEAGKLRTKVAELEQRQPEPRVVLEKVAASADIALVTDTVNTLVSNGLVPAAQRTQILSDLQTDPARIYKLAAKLAQFSNPAHQEGAGVPKKASTTAVDSDPDGWGKMAREGA